MCAAANYRTVWALKKHFPKVKSYVRAHDVEQGLNLERAGATAVVPETLEPSLQVLSPLNLKEFGHCSKPGTHRVSKL